MVSFKRLKKVTISVDENQILFFKAEGKLSLLVLESNDRVYRYYINHLLLDVEQLFKDNTLFLRIHKSYLINLSKVSKVDSATADVVELKGVYVPIARRRSKLFKDAMIMIRV